jgi:hypothetical protein
VKKKPLPHSPPPGPKVRILVLLPCSIHVSRFTFHGIVGADN